MKIRKEYTKINGTLTLQGSMPVFDSNNDINLLNDVVIPGAIVKDDNGTTYTQNLQNKAGTIALTNSVYAHHLHLIGVNTKTQIYLTLLTNFSTPFSVSAFIAYMEGFASTSAISASGTVVYSRVGTIENCRGVAAVCPGSTSGVLGVIYHDAGDAGVVQMDVGQSGAQTDLGSVVDTVFQVL